MTAARRIVLTALAALSLVGLTACGDHRLTAQGHVRITTADATTAFELPQEIRLDGAGTAARVTGMCTISRGTAADGRTTYGAVIDLYRSDAADDGLGLRSVTLMRRDDDTPGTIEAQLGSTQFRTAAAGCADLAITYIDGDGTVILGGECELRSADNDVATADVDLTVRGCTVIDG